MEEAPTQRFIEDRAEIERERERVLEEERRNQQRDQERLPPVFLQPSAPDHENEGLALEEYKELCETIRIHANLRFAILTVFIAFTGGLVYLFFGNDYNLTPFAQRCIGFAGIIITGIFFVNEERGRAWHMHFQRRAAHLERVFLGFNSYSTSPRPMKLERKILKFIPFNSGREPSPSDSLSTISIWFLYLLVSIFWLIILICPGTLRQPDSVEPTVVGRHDTEQI